MSKTTYGTSHVPLSPVVRTGDFVYAPGQVPAKPDGELKMGSIEAQTRQALGNINLAMAGCSMDDVAKALVTVSDVCDFAAMNRAYQSYFPPDPPAHTTLEARLMRDINIETEAVACKLVDSAGSRGK